MAIFKEKSVFETLPAIRYVIYAIIALMLSVLHVVFVRLISVQGIAPDLLLVLTVWIALAEGQFVGLFAGFFCGFLFDVVSDDVMGSNALAKTLAGFVAGFFYSQKDIEKTLGGAKLLIVVGIGSLFHNIIYFFFYLRPTEISFGSFFLQYGVASSLYTVVSALFPMLVRSQRLQGR